MTDNLTPEQREGIKKIREKWMAIGLNTDPANREEAEEGARQIYAVAGLEAPEYFIWTSSPFEAMIAANLVEQASYEDLPTLQEKVDYAVKHERDPKKYRYIGTYITGQHQAPVLAVYEYMREYMDYQEAERLEGQNRIAANACWWWPFDRVVVFSDRPYVVSRDAQDQLHNETGPSIGFRDGYALYHWHGVRVPPDLIEEGWDAERILREPNAEVRRCAIEKLGWPEFIEAAGLQQIGNEEEDPGNPGRTLKLYSIPEQIYEEEVNVVVCTNATPERTGEYRQFGITTPAEIKDPVAAIAWSFNVTRDEYVQLGRAC